MTGQHICHYNSGSMFVAAIRTPYLWLYNLDNVFVAMIQLHDNARTCWKYKNPFVLNVYFAIIIMSVVAC